MSASLVILAAGLGTRFKEGIKQLTPVGAADELLMEYSVYDAINAGFDKVIFIIRRDIEEMVKEAIGNKLSKYIDVQYCFQDIDDLPGDFLNPENRKKPWGTVHAVLAASDLINEPFLIINADDYYGQRSYIDIYNFLTNSVDDSEQCMGGFVLKNTLSNTGAVTRGISETDENDTLISVTETYKISKTENGIITGTQNNNIVELNENSVVSMNMWGFKKSIIPKLRDCFIDFLECTYTNGKAETAEFALPSAVDKLIKQNKIHIKVLPTSDKWYGMTFIEDIPEIKNSFAELTDKGIYSVPLFSE